ncbi:protein Niban 1a isoform X1 [Trematomus bernacchii]|uniref:protein Niban 1a isoform X1 n=1 Tax=Trematomus bernacchii TaxID=40690 RepID=UPI00146B73CE|nr:protein Niban 1a isoform X1 [Trematomus bernacchii]
MGISASSLLDETKSNYIKGQAETTLKEFSPYYRKQFSVARFSQVEDDLEQRKEKIMQLLKQKEATEEGEVLYEEAVLFFDETRKWKERYVVVRANYCLECHDGLETFFKGIPPRQKMLPTGGSVLTTEEKYMAMVDKFFTDDTNVNEDFAPPLSGMPGQFPVYLRLPYRRDFYFCFKQQAKQDAFLSILSDCIRHQNQDFLKKKTCEVQAFLKAIQLYRQDKDRYESWDMLIGSDVRVMANVVMEQLLPSLEKDMLPRLKAKKTEKKRVWFATVEAAYILIQEHLLEGLSALKEECRTSLRQQEVLIHSDMDQILESRWQLEEKVRAKVSEPAEKLCCESVQPYLGSVLEELMEPVSSGFQEGRQLSETMMDKLCQDVMMLVDNEQVKEALAKMARPNLLSCYQKIGSLQEKLQHLQERFGFSNIKGVIHSAQIDLQQLMENAAHTFGQLLNKAVQDNPDNPGSAIDKAKHRVLKQYDHDSSTVRKRISREALVSITLPYIKKNLAPTCKTELQSLEQTIDGDHFNYIHVENVYEIILLQTLDKEVTKVVKEAASLKKYNLFTDSRDLLSQSSRSSLSSPSPAASTPNSPAMMLASPSITSSEPPPPSPLAFNGLSFSSKKEEKMDNGVLPSEASTDVTTIETPLGKVEEKDAAPTISEEATPTKAAEEVVQAVKEEEGLPVSLETPEVTDTAKESETQEVNVEAAPETVIQDNVFAVETKAVEVAAEPQMQTTAAPRETEITLSEVPTVVESKKKEEEAASASTEAPVSSPDSSVEPEKAPVPSPDSSVEPEKAPVPSPDSSTEPEHGPVAVADSSVEPEKAPVPSPDSSNETPVPSSETMIEPEKAPLPSPTIEPENTSAEEAACQTLASSEEESHCVSSEIKLEAPSSGETHALTPEDISLDLKRQEEETVTVSNPNCLDVSVGSESAPSDVESMEEGRTTQSSGDEVSTTSDVLDEANISNSPVSSDEQPEDKITVDDPCREEQTEAASEDVEAGTNVEPLVEAEESTTSQPDESTPSQPPEPTEAETSSSPEARPIDSVKAIRDLVMEVIEVEELVKRYPSGVPTEEE